MRSVQLQRKRPHKHCRASSVQRHPLVLVGPVVRGTAATCLAMDPFSGASGLGGKGALGASNRDACGWPSPVWPYDVGALTFLLFAFWAL